MRVRATGLCSSVVVLLILGACGGLAFLTTASHGRTAVGPLDAGKDRPSLIIAPDREFAGSSYVHKQLSADTPRDPRSAELVAELQRQIRTYSGAVSVNIDQYSPPVYVVSNKQPTVRVRAERAYDPTWAFEPIQQQWESVPLPDSFQPSAGSDKEAIVYQPSTGHYWEFWGMEKSGRTISDSSGRTVDEWRAAWGGKIDNLATNPGYFPTTPEGYKFGTAATGLVLLAGLITIAEQRQGAINHSLHIALPNTRRGVWADPAQRTDGAADDADAIPQGATFRIPESLNLDEIEMDPYARMLARAVQRYGMVVRDTAGIVALYAENPMSKRGEDHPYFGVGGILRCPGGRIEASCYADSNNRLRGFPWDKLEVVQAMLHQ